MAPAVTTVGTRVTVPPLDGYRAKQCARRLHNDLVGIDEALRDPDSAHAVELMADGVVFESEIGTTLEAMHSPRHYDDAIKAIVCGKGKRAEKVAAAATELAGVSMFFVPECDRSVASKKRRELLTEAAMAAGVDVIWNTRLRSDGKRSGEPDYLVRLGESPKADGNWAYVPCDVKHHRALSGTAKAKDRPVSDLSDLTRSAAVLRDIGPGSARIEDVKQLAHYTHMLDFLGHRTDENAIGAIVGTERVAVWHDLDEAAFLHAAPGSDAKRTRCSAMEIYAAEFEFRHEVAARALEINAGSDEPALAVPERKAECGSCPWNTVCSDELREQRHITLLPGITPARAKAHYAAGVTSIDALARLDVATATVIDAKGDPGVVRRIANGAEEGDSVTTVLAHAGVKNASALAGALAGAGVSSVADLAKLDPATSKYAGSGVWNLPRSIDQARVYLAERVCRARGVEWVSIVDPAIALHFDVENDGDFVYLIRFHAVGKKKVGGETKRRVESHPFVTWETTPESEAQVFADAWAYVGSMQEKARSGKYSLRAFHYTGHERSVFCTLANRHAGHPGVPSVADVEAWFDSEEVCDLHAVLTSQLVWPTEDVTLKTLAKYVRFMWRDEDPSGGNSIAWYRCAVDGALSETEREEYRQRVLDYNEDDCAATAALVEFISRLGEARRPAAKLPSVESLEPRFRRRR